MKLNNIIAILLVVIAMFSCTAESDILDDMDKSNNNTTEITGEKMAYLSLKVGSENMATKAITDGGTRPGDYISSLVFFLLEKTTETDYKVVKCAYRSFEEIETVTEKVLSKVTKNLYVLVVTNPGYNLSNDLQNCTTYKEICEVSATRADAENLCRPMCNKELVKVDFGDIKGTSSTSDVELAKNTVHVDVEVSSIVAPISLPKFQVEYKGQAKDNRPAVKLTSVQFFDLKQTTGLFEEGGNAYFDSKELVDKDGGFNALVVGEKEKDEDLMDLQKLFVVAYPNTTKPVTVKLAFTVGTGKMQRIENREYTINPTGDAGIPAMIHAGYWYNLEVTVKVGTNVDVELACKTLDWKDNVCNIPVEEVK